MVNLKTLRLEKGLTQTELAARCGVVRQVISNIECGSARPSIKTAKALAKALEIEWPDFFNDEKSF